LDGAKKHIVFLSFIPFIVYIFTASRTLPWGDGAEFYVAIRNLGIPHPSGYPFFLLLGRLFYCINSSPMMLNILPGIFTTAAILFAYLILKEMTQDRFIAISLSLFLAFGTEIWQQSVVAEVYTLNLLIFVIMFYLILRNEKDPRAAPAIFFCSGLALTNHLTSLFYIIPMLVFLSLRKPKTLYYTPLTIIPLFLYLYLPMRSRLDPIPDLFNPETLSSLMAYVSGRAFQYRTFFFSGSYLIGELLVFLRAFWTQFFVLIPCGIYGFLYIRNKSLRNLLIIILVVISGYTLFYNIPDKQGYYLPVYGIWLIFTAAGLKKLIPKNVRPVLFILPVVSMFVNYRICDYSKDSSLGDLCSVIHKGLSRHSIFISDDYFVYCNILNQELNNTKHIIPVSQFYLRMDWYIEHLKTHYPEIKIPQQANRLITECNIRLLHATKKEYGEISKQYCHEIQKELVNANIDEKNIFLFVYDDAIWPQQWFDFHLEYHGIHYQVRRDSVSPSIFPLKLPSAARYRTDILVHEDAIAVSKKFAAAYNRRGIYRYHLNDFRNAIDDFGKALEYYPGYYQVYSNLGLVYLNLGDTLKTLRAWQKYIENAEKGPKLDRIKSWYNQLQKEKHP